MKIYNRNACLHQIRIKKHHGTFVTNNNMHAVKHPFYQYVMYKIIYATINKFQFYGLQTGIGRKQGRDRFLDIGCVDKCSVRNKKYVISRKENSYFSVYLLKLEDFNFIQSVSGSFCRHQRT